MRTKPFPYPFPQNCKRTRTKLVSLAAVFLDVTQRSAKYDKKHLTSLIDAVIILIIPHNFSNFVRTLRSHSASWLIYAFANYSNVNDANGSTHIILIPTILPQRNLRRFPFNENSGFKFRKFHMPYGTVVSGCTYPTQSIARLVIREL